MFGNPSTALTTPIAPSGLMTADLGGGGFCCGADVTCVCIRGGTGRDW